MLLILINLYIQTHIYPKLQAGFLSSKCQRNNFSIFRSIGFKKQPISFIYWSLESLRNFLISTYLDFQTSIPETTDFHFFLTGLVFKLLTSVGIINRKLLIFIRSGILMEQKCQKVLLVLACPDIQSHVSSAQPVSFCQQGVN